MRSRRQCDRLSRSAPGHNLRSRRSANVERRRRYCVLQDSRPDRPRPRMGCRRRLMPTLDEPPSHVCGKRSYDRPCVPAAPARLRDQELFSVVANRYFRTKAIERWIGIDCDLNAFDLAAVIAGLTNNLRKLSFM